MVCILACLPESFPLRVEIYRTVARRPLVHLVLGIHGIRRKMRDESRKVKCNCDVSTLNGGNVQKKENVSPVKATIDTIGSSSRTYCLVTARGGTW